MVAKALFAHCFDAVKANHNKSPLRGHLFTLGEFLLLAPVADDLSKFVSYEGVLKRNEPFCVSKSVSNVSDDI
ncbi:hypothetical protein ACVWWG_002027 [Bradyrhizobium sp. LB7.2]